MRTQFHRKLDELEELLVANAETADGMLGDALAAMMARDEERAADVIARDGRVDERYEKIQRDVINTLALQAPVASDLRLIAAMLHVNIHLERMGDYATSVAKMVKRSVALPDDPDLAEQIRDMGEHARTVGQAAIRSFTQRDAELAGRLPQMDDAVDTLNRGIFHRLVKLATQDETRLEWAERLLVAPRFIERYGDHAVDIGEQVIFVVTGHTIELSSNAPSRR